VGAIFPDQKELRSAAARVAAAVIREVQRQQGKQPAAQTPVEEAVRAAMWYPEYPNFA
jgi:hypothetical protein